jgi:hypothetical protein
MDDENNNTPNTQGTDGQMPDDSGMNGESEDRGTTPTPNNGEGEQPNVDNVPTGSESDDNDNDEDTNDQRTGVNFDDHQ